MKKVLLAALIGFGVLVMATSGVAAAASRKPVDVGSKQIEFEWGQWSFEEGTIISCGIGPCDSSDYKRVGPFTISDR